MKKRNFTSDELEEIHRLYFQEKMSKKNVGTKFGVSEITIVRVFKENKWRGRKQGESVVLSKQEFKKLVDSGKSDEEIATITGLSKASLNHKRRQLGIAKKHGPPPKIIDAELIEKHTTQNLTVAEISKKISGKNFDTNIRQRLIDLGVYSQDEDWKKSRKKMQKFDGEYYKTKLSGHHRSDKKGWVPTHVLLMEGVIGREIPESEPVHHVDWNKKNNVLDNLLHCKNRQEHSRLQDNMEAELSKLIQMGVVFFDRKNAEYRINFKNPKKMSEKKINPKTAKRSGYRSVVKPVHHRADVRGRVLEHIVIMEKILGREIPESEPVHHIDFDKENNNKDNLYPCRNHNEHNQKIRNSINSVATKLSDMEILKFDHPTRSYFIQKDVLDNRMSV